MTIGGRPCRHRLKEVAEKPQEPLADARGSETAVRAYSHLPSRDGQGVVQWSNFLASSKACATLNQNKSAPAAEAGERLFGRKLRLEREPGADLYCSRSGGSKALAGARCR